MVQVRLALLLLRPSWLSFGVVTLATTLMVGLANWSYFTYNEQVYDYFYGTHGLITTLEQSPDMFALMQHGLTNNPFVYGFIVLFFAALAGVAVFVGIYEIEHGIWALRLLRAATGADKHERLGHLTTRVVVLGVWLVYTFFSINIALPFGLLLSRIGAEDITTLGGAIISMGGVILFALVLHGHIILARMFCLRPRVFGGEIAIEEAFYNENK